MGPVHPLQQVPELVLPHRDGRRDDHHPLVAAGLHRRFDRRFHPQNGKAVFPAQKADGRAGRGVAGDDDGDGAPPRQKADRFVGVAHDLFPGLFPVRDVVGVGVIEEPRLRQRQKGLVQDRDSADAGIENPDFHGVGQGFPTVWPTMATAYSPPYCGRGLLRSISTVSRQRPRPSRAIFSRYPIARKPHFA